MIIIPKNIYNIIIYAYLHSIVDLLETKIQCVPCAGNKPFYAFLFFLDYLDSYHPMHTIY